jgi:hypothetical protein
MDTNQVDVFLSVLERREAENWEWHRYPDSNCWLGIYKGYQPPCKFHIEADDSLLYLHAEVHTQIWAECRLALYRYALRLNEELPGAKFGLNNQGQLALMIEWPLDRLTFTTFEAAVQMLLAYYQAYYHDLQMVAQNPILAQYITASEVQQQTAEQAIQIEIEGVQ